MITILVDHNIEGQAALLAAALGKQGWLEAVPLRFLSLAEAGLPDDADDRALWQLAQTQQMFLLTNNRNNEGANSLQQTIEDENTPTSLPVINIGQAKRLVEKEYRERCITRLLDIILYPESYLGTGRQFIP